MSDASVKTQVLIVGGGPFGLMLAIELGRRQVQAIVVDPKPGTAFNPQANATQARTMEHFRRLGFADEVRAVGLPPDHPTDIAYFTRYSTVELARLRLPTARQAQVMAPTLTGSWSAAELPHRVSQKFVEPILHRHAAAEPTISLNYGQRLERFTEFADRVEAEITDVESGETRHITADYLIGGDGARSTVRQQLGIGYGGEAGVRRHFFGGRMVALYLKSHEIAQMMSADPAWMYWAFNAERRSWLASVDGADEFVFHTQLKGEEEDEPVTEERARELFFQTVGKEVAVEFLAIDKWIAGHALVAEGFGRDRVYIGGDAAHLFTPAGGLGYNTAVEDAVNLGWKLAAAVNGQAGPELLPSYEFERRKVAIRNTGYARQLADSIGNFLPDPHLEEDSPRGQKAREEAGVYLQGHASREFNIPGVTFGGRYDGSPVIVSDGSEPPADAPNSYEPTACPGGRPPHLWLDDGRSLFDVFGKGWTLLDTRPGRAAVGDFEKAASSIDLTVVQLDDARLRELYEADLVLIRPDHIVAWRGAADTDPARLFAQVLGYGDALSPANPLEETV